MDRECESFMKVTVEFDGEELQDAIDFFVAYRRFEQDPELWCSN